jgi:ribosomal protein S6--L-glutamate ligase
LKDPPAVIFDNQTLFTCYQQLKKNDIICGRIRLKPGEEHLLLDLCERGVRLIPSATAQLASRSKSYQAKIFSEFMLPGTLAIYDTHALLSASSFYRQQQYTKVIVKHDRKNGGLGIHIFNDIEELYNHAGTGPFSFPFVIQPYHGTSRDIRVIILGDYLEAYERVNPHNLRKNLHCGGHALPYTIPDQQLDFCRNVMQRGKFPYAHLDLMLTADGTCYLMEINLRGGLKGAILSGREYLDKLATIHEGLLTKMKALRQE